MLLLMQDMLGTSSWVVLIYGEDGMGIYRGLSMSSWISDNRSKWQYAEVVLVVLEGHHGLITNETTIMN